MIGTAVIFGAAITGSVVFLYSKMPGPLKRFAVKHYLLSDIALTALIYAVIGAGSATALFASAVAWCSTSTLLWIGNRRLATVH